MIDIDFLKMKIPSNGYRLKDLGIVDSVIKTAEFVRGGVCRKDLKLGDSLVGKMILRGKGIYIFYSDQGSLIENTRVRGHEIGHVIDRMGGLYYVDADMYKNKGFCVNFPRVDNPEVRADLVSLYGLDIWEFNIEEPDWGTFCNNHFIEARGIYLDAKFKR